jgi:hypothetical protein
VIAGTDPGLGRGIASGRKLPHVVTELGEDLVRASARNTGNRIQVLERSGHQLSGVRDPTIELTNLLFDKLEVGDFRISAASPFIRRL